MKQMEVERSTKQPGESNGWLDNVKAPVELTELKGKVVQIMEPREVQTKDYGKRKVMEIVIEAREGEVSVTEFLPARFPRMSPFSNLGKIMKKYGCKTLKELIGKEVELEKGKQENYKIRKV